MKVSKCLKFGDLRLETVTLVRFLKSNKCPEVVKGNVRKFAWDRG